MMCTQELETQSDLPEMDLYLKMVAKFLLEQFLTNWKTVMYPLYQIVCGPSMSFLPISQPTQRVSLLLRSNYESIS